MRCGKCGLDGEQIEAKLDELEMKLGVAEASYNLVLRRAKELKVERGQLRERVAVLEKQPIENADLLENARSIIMGATWGSNYRVDWKEDAERWLQSWNAMLSARNAASRESE